MTKFKFTLAPPTMIKQVISATTTLVDELTFTVSKEGGLSFRTMDPSHVAMLDISLPPSAFDDWAVEEEGRFTVRMEELDKIFRRADKKDVVRVKFEEKLEISFLNSYQRDFTIHPLETTTGDIPLPKLAFNAKVVTPNLLLKSLFEDVAAVADTATLEASPEEFAIKGRGDAGQGRANLRKGDPLLLELDVKEPSKATYSIKYLLDIVKSIIDVENTRIEFSSKLPCMLHYELKPMGFLDFYLAPRIGEMESA